MGNLFIPLSLCLRRKTGFKTKHRQRRKFLGRFICLRLGFRQITGLKLNLPEGIIISGNFLLRLSLCFGKTFPKLNLFAGVNF